MGDFQQHAARAAVAAPVFGAAGQLQLGRQPAARLHQRRPLRIIGNRIRGIQVLQHERQFQIDGLFQLVDQFRLAADGVRRGRRRQRRLGPGLDLRQVFQEQTRFWQRQFARAGHVVALVAVLRIAHLPHQARIRFAFALIRQAEDLVRHEGIHELVVTHHMPIEEGVVDPFRRHVVEVPVVGQHAHAEILFVLASPQHDSGRARPASRQGQCRVAVPERRRLPLHGQQRAVFRLCRQGIRRRQRAAVAALHGDRLRECLVLARVRRFQVQLVAVRLQHPVGFVPLRQRVAQAERARSRAGVLQRHVEDAVVAPVVAVQRFRNPGQQGAGGVLQQQVAERLLAAQHMCGMLFRNSIRAARGKRNGGRHVERDAVRMQLHQHRSQAALARLQQAAGRIGGQLVAPPQADAAGHVVEHGGIGFWRRRHIEQGILHRQAQHLVVGQGLLQGMHAGRQRQVWIEQEMRVLLGHGELEQPGAADFLIEEMPAVFLDVAAT